MKVAHLGNGFRADQRHVSRKHQDVAVSGNVLTGAHDGMAGAALFGLQNKLYAHGRDRGAYAFRLMADDHVNMFSRDNLLRRLDHMRQQRLAANLMQYLGAFRLEPGAFAGSHDYDCEIARASYLFLRHVLPWASKPDRKSTTSELQSR